jgi:Lectin C-type domain
MNMNLHFLSLALLGITLASPAGAQSWVINPSNGHAYSLSKIGTWKQGQAEAKSWGANLATVRSKAENDWLVKTFKPASASNWLWIGFNDEAKEGSWVWVSGEKVGYTNWCKGEPNNANGGEDYAHMNDATGCWNDVITAAQMRGIMERTTAPPKASFTAFGSGCGSSTKTPTLSSSMVPILGKPFSVKLSNLTPGTVGVLILGNSTKTWNGTALPLDLKGIGMTGCRLYVSYDFLVAFNTGSGSFAWNATVPSDPQLLGIPFHAQAWNLDPKANFLGVGMSNAGSGKIGF